MSGRVIVVGSVNVDVVIRVDTTAGAGRDRDRRPVRAASRRQGRQPGRRGGPAGGRGDRSSVRSATTPSAGARAPPSPPRASTCPGSSTLDDEPTGVALILVDRDGENSIAVAGGANMALDSVQVRDALKRLALTREDVVLVGHEIRTGATHEALRLGRIAGATTILNPAPAAGLAGPTLDLADILTPNRGELAVACRRRGQAREARQGVCLARRRAIGPSSSASAPTERCSFEAAARPPSRPRPWRSSTPWAPATR